jgi:hypothetical protein
MENQYLVVFDTAFCLLRPSELPKTQAKAENRDT